jgi:histidine ammonia-lyase
MIEISGDGLKLDDVLKVAIKKEKVSLSFGAHKKMQASRDYIDKRINSGEVMYGINTGFGAFSSVKINNQDLIQLQKNLIRSHAMGIGEFFTVEQSRAIMLLRANALSRGHSGIRPIVVEKIIEFLNADIVAAIPQQGSVGASGDLAPLSHLALALIGEGEVWSNGSVVSVATVLSAKGIVPLELQAKEGLSLINGCQVMTAVGLLALAQARDLLKLTDVSGAMSLEGLRGSRLAFDPLISQTRPHIGEAKTAANLRKVLGESSQISSSHVDCDKVQDAYSIRCMPAVHGAAKVAWNHILQTLEIEANSSTDNPLVFAEANKVLSCGNFHGMPVAMAMDYAAIAFSSLANITECRIEKLINPSMSGLPAFLAPNGGLNSGHMIVQVAAASLVSENKVLSHPASVDSIPTSADKEDHVSMGTIAARKFQQIIKNVQNVVAMEFLSASQALDLLKPLEPSSGVSAAYKKIREVVPFAETDRVFYRDVEKIRELIINGSLLAAIEKETGELSV